MSYFAGIDLHKRYLTLCVLDLDGNVVVQHRQLTTDGLFAVLAELDGPITVAVEATLHWAWLHDRLVQHGYAVQVADPGQVKLICKARCKTDPIDARKLTDLVRTNLLPAIWVPDPATRANRKLLRGYAFLVRIRTRIKNRVHAYLAEINLASPATDLFGKQGRVWMDSLSLPDEVRFQVDGLLDLLDSLETRIRRVAKRIEQRVDMTPEAQLLLTVPGIGAKTAMLIMAEIGTLDRFPSSNHLTSFAGLVPTTRSSGGKTTHGSLPRAGSPWLRWALVETTQTLKMKPGPVRAHFTRLTRAKGNSKATVAAARKLCCYLFWMLKEGRTYPDWLHNRHSQPFLEVRPT
jgi:transposase